MTPSNHPHTRACASTTRRGNNPVSPNRHDSGFRAALSRFLRLTSPSRNKPAYT